MAPRNMQNRFALCLTDRDAFPAPQPVANMPLDQVGLEGLRLDRHDRGPQGDQRPSAAAHMGSNVENEIVK